MMINLLNFPYNLEEIIEEKESPLNKDFSIGDWICYVLSKGKINREKLSQDLKITPEELKKMETDTSVPSDDWMKKMQKLLD